MSDQYLSLPLALLSPDPNQPRRELESDNPSVTEAATLQGLANSIQEVGMLQPIRVHSVVTNEGVTRYMIVSGQRRFEAAKMLGMATVPCLVVDDPEDAPRTLVSQVAENLQRKAMTATELALAVQSLVQTGATQEEVARKLGIQPSQVTLLLNLLVLSGPVKLAFARGRIESPRAAYDLNKLPPALQEKLIGESEQKNRIMTQRDVREQKQWYVKELRQVRHRYEAPDVTQQEYDAIEKSWLDGIEDSYDESPDRDAVFGKDWRDIHGATPSADTVDVQRVRVPEFLLTRDQVAHLYALLGLKDKEKQFDNKPDAEQGPALGKDLAKILSQIKVSDIKPSV
jgi:ParB/RepB/Spo0J family partition protein